MKSPVLVLDFDGVLFDNENFRKDYLCIFSGFGIPAYTVDKVYQEGKSYARGYHALLMRRFAAKLDAKTVVTHVASLLEKSSEYLYPDTMDFLHQYRKNKIPLALVSTGPALQQHKVRASGIMPFFTNNTIIQNASKVPAIQ